MMQTAQVIVRDARSMAADLAVLAAIEPTLILAFGSVAALQQGAAAIALAFPQALRAGCSTAGEIFGNGVENDSLVLTAVRFAQTRVVQASTVLAGMHDSRAAGERLATALPRSGLRAILLFGQGVQINGSALLAGMAAVVGSDTPIAGGLAGDGGAFARTWVLDAQGLSSERLTCLGLYGAGLVFTHGSFGGWSPFGPARKVTRCEHNVLFELDGEPALAVYKRYLGEHARHLPASGLLFPFAMLGSDHQEVGLIRTILGVDDSHGSLTLAGDIDPQGYLRLMHASTDALVDGAAVAAQAARTRQNTGAVSLSLLVSCVGRKLVMGGRVDEEVEAVAQVLPQGSTLAGFYSYGEIGPYGHLLGCKLHNQTMTVAFIAETA